MLLLKTTIDDFLSKPMHYRDYEKNSVRNLLQGKNAYSLTVINGEELDVDALKKSIQ